MYKPLQGQYRLKNPQKYIKAVDKFMNSEQIIDNNIILKYKSSLELKSFLYCDLNPVVEKWGLETFNIPYIGVDGRSHRYYPDLIIVIQGNVYVVEIKHSSDCKKPSKGKNYESRLCKYLTNQLKWDACRKFCEQRNSKFIILTEEVLNK